MNESKKKEEKKVEEEVEEKKEELSPLEKIQQAVDAKKKKEAGSIAEALDLPAEEEKEKEEEVEEEKEEVEEKEKEEKKEDEKEEETEEEEKEDEKEGEEKEEESALLAEIARVSALAAGHETELQKEKPEKEGEEKEGKKEEKKNEYETFMHPVDTKEVEFIKKDTMGETFDAKDVTSMNKVLNKVFNEVRKQTRQIAMQDAFRIIPQIVDQRVEGHLAAMEYWRKNPELEKLANQEKYAGLKDYVAIKADEAQKKNPKFTLGQVYNQVDKEVRAVFGDRLKGSKEDQVDSEGKKGLKRLPLKPGATRSRKIPEIDRRPIKLKSQQDQMTALSKHKNG